MNCLDESIEHWERVLQLVKSEDIPSLKEEGWNGDSCACCAEFIDDSEDEDCIGCPVRNYTGQPDCLDTPWWNANAALWELIRADKNLSEALIRVTDELEFLREVRDA